MEHFIDLPFALKSMILLSYARAAGAGPRKPWYERRYNLIDFRLLATNWDGLFSMPHLSLERKLYIRRKR